MRARHGHLEVVSGEVPPDLLAACRALAAEDPSCEGLVVLRGEIGEESSVQFQGRFGEPLRQGLRSLWSVRGEGSGGPASPEVFAIAVEGGGVRALLGEPPEIVARFCRAYARANPSATARVAGRAAGSGVDLHVDGEIPPQVRERLQRRWREGGARASILPPAPRRRRRPGRLWGVAAAVVGCLVLLAVAAERRGVIWFYVPLESPDQAGPWSPGVHPDDREGPDVAALGQGAGPAGKMQTRAESSPLDGEGGLGEPVRGPDEWPAVIERLRERRRAAPTDERLRVELARAHHAYGASLAQHGEWEPAAAHVETAVRLAPEEARFREDLSRLFLAGAQAMRAELRRGWGGGHSVEKARHWVEQAIRANREWAPAHLVLGDLEYEEQRLREARAAWVRAGELVPGLPGLAERLGRLEREFSAEVRMQEIEGYDFIVRHEEGVGAALGGFDLRSVLDETRQRVGNAFDHWPRRRIVVLLYTPESYRNVRSETPLWSGGLYDGKIRIPVPAAGVDPEAVRYIVAHEYTHAVVDDLSKGRCPRWLNEGLAELQAARHSGRNRVAEVRERARRSPPTPWRALDAALQGSSAELVRHRYDEAHSAVAYLTETHGFWRLRAVLAALGEGGGVETAVSREFHLSLDELEGNWHRWLAAGR
ncbi:MAG: hypothetical protein AB1578_09960 [Thermodesulfobacteriota bacterium]